jgi:hypothetical protein
MGMTDEPDKALAEDDEDRLVIPLDPEVALEALLKVDPVEMPPDENTPTPEKKSSS